jgi:hypothetical protein
MPIVVEAVEQTDYLIWSILKEGIPEDVEIPDVLIDDLYNSSDSASGFTAADCRSCEFVIKEAWDGICILADGVDDVFHRKPRQVCFMDLFPRTAPTQFFDLVDPCTPEIRILLNAYGETLVADRNGYIYRLCKYCDNIVLTRFEEFNYRQYYYRGKPEYVCHNEYSHRVTYVLLACYAACFFCPPLSFLFFGIIPIWIKI